jgi:hypothetical protein
MWKHEIIKDLSAISLPGLPVATFDVVESCIRGLSSSHEIYAGETDNFDEVGAKRANDTFCYSKIHAPFQKTLITFSHAANGYRGGLYIDASEAGFALLVGLIFEGRWTIEPFAMALLEDELGQARVVPLCDTSYLSSETNAFMQRCFIQKVTLATSVLDVINCKNVSLSPVDQIKSNASSKKTPRAKRRAKEGKSALFRYYVLMLDLNKGRALAGKTGAGLGSVPVHLCRGHFKEYTAEKPLFGRVTGRFWWQPRARGKPENGVVMKDYAIKQPSLL